MTGSQSASPERIYDERGDYEEEPVTGEIPGLTHTATPTHRENGEVQHLWYKAMLAFLSLSLGIMSGLHVVLEEEGEKSNVDSQGEGVGNGDPEISVEVEQHHADTASSTAEPPVGLVQVLQEEIGEQGGANEEEGVHRVLPLGYGLKEDAANMFGPDLADILHVLNMQSVVSKGEVMSQYNPAVEYHLNIKHNQLFLQQ